MTFKPALWRPVAAVLSMANLVAVGFAAGLAQPWHATVHAGLALAFGAWAQRLGRSPALAGQAEPASRLESLEAEVDQLRGEVAGADERLHLPQAGPARASAVRRPDAEPPR